MFLYKFLSKIYPEASNPKISVVPLGGGYFPYL